jgi:hypothetical protein
LDPATEAIDKTSGGANVWEAGDTCLSSLIGADAASSSLVPMFTSEITSSPRFGFVPIIPLGGGRDAQQIEGFMAVYLDLAFGSGSKVDSIMAWVFPLDLIQQSDLGPGGGIGAYLGGPYVTNLCSLAAGNC